MSCFAELPTNSCSQFGFWLTTSCCGTGRFRRHGVVYRPHEPVVRNGQILEGLVAFQFAPSKHSTISRQLRLQTPHVPPCFAQCPQYLQFLHA